MEAFYYIKSAKQLANLQLILEETARAKLFWTGYREKKIKRPCVWLVKDQGAYLMSAVCPVLQGAIPGLEHSDGKPVVAYVDKFGPKCDWDKQQEAWGGNDFCFDLDVPRPALAKIKNGERVKAARIRVEIDGRELQGLTLGLQF